MHVYDVLSLGSGVSDMDPLNHSHEDVGDAFRPWTPSGDPASAPPGRRETSAFGEALGGTPLSDEKKGLPDIDELVSLRRKHVFFYIY